ncbi:Rrf2 family transcriptional regulator [Aminipila butyrica]|uniref:Rrf2 family transcriptional regulator n=1 Tax=Aminipila butyrica TaxID=433296 RepID=A0A858C0J9_9FIRM|nr:Rrf2 family transcriptional regulator [Aminipila butyrica]
MLITRETDYALRILRALADGKLLNSAAICEQEALPQHFTYKILKKLNKAGVIRILRGVEGGCQLTADLKMLSLYDLISITEGQRAISSCMEANFQCQWQQKFGSRCQIHQNLQVIQNSLDQQLKTYSIYDMLFKEKSC